MNNKRSFMLSVPYVAAVVSFFFICTANQSFVLFPVALKSNGSSDSFIGFVMGVAVFSGFIFRPLFGQWLDKYGRKRFVLLGSLLSALCILLYLLPVYTSPLLLFAVRCLHGIAYAMYFTAIWTWVADFSPKDRLAEGIGIFGVAGLSANASGSFGGELILRMYGGSYSALYIAAALITFLGLLISLFLKPTEPRGTSAGKRKGFVGILKNKLVARVAFISLFFGVSMGVVNNFVSVYIMSIGNFTSASFFPYYALAAVLTRLFTGTVADKFGRLTVIFPGVFLQSLGQLALAFPATAVFPGVIGFLMGTAHGLIYPAMNALLLERAGLLDRGSGSALFNAAIDCGNFGGSFVFGFVAHSYGYNIMYTVSSFVIFAGLISFILMEKSDYIAAFMRKSKAD